MIDIIIIKLGKMIIAKKEEIIAVSNLFNNNIKRKVRRNYKYKTECWLEIK